jgi:hypothetical protein
MEIEDIRDVCYEQINHVISANKETNVRDGEHVFSEAVGLLRNQDGRTTRIVLSSGVSKFAPLCHHKFAPSRRRTFDSLPNPSGC